MSRRSGGPLAQSSRPNALWTRGSNMKTLTAHLITVRAQTVRPRQQSYFFPKKSEPIPTGKQVGEQVVSGLGSSVDGVLKACEGTHDFIESSGSDVPQIDAFIAVLAQG